MISSKILIVDDEQGFREQLTRWLSNEGYYDTEQAANAEEALALVRKINFDVVLLDLKLPDMNGFLLLEKLHREHPDICVIILTGFGSKDSSAKVREAGAFDFFEKPINFETLISRIDAAINQFRLQSSSDVPHEDVKQEFKFESIVGESDPIRRVFDMIQRVARSDETILIQGENGTGKELVACAIHYNSSRRQQPFVIANCATLSETLAESELFGHEKGAFTNAVSTRIGKFQNADKGSLFVDEVGELSPNLQLRFLRFLEKRTFERLGGHKPINVDVRVIASTNVNLAEAVSAKKFRQDLYFRISRFILNVPPLRERQGDIPLLVRHFIKKHNRRHGKNIEGISKPALELLENYHFPGNVRELENIIASAILLEDGDRIKPETIHTRLISTVANSSTDFKGMNYRDAKKNFERQYFTQLLEQTHGKISPAARLAGLDRSHFRAKLKDLGMGMAQESESEA